MVLHLLAPPPPPFLTTSYSAKDSFVLHMSFDLGHARHPSLFLPFCINCHMGKRTCNHTNSVAVNADVSCAPGNKVIVFAHHLAVLDHLQQELGEENSTIRINGSTNMTTRKKRIDQFQEEPSVKLAILSVTAAGVRPYQPLDPLLLQQPHPPPPPRSPCAMVFEM